MFSVPFSLCGIVDAPMLFSMSHRLLLVFSLLVLFLAGCSGGGDSAQSGSPEQPSAPAPADFLLTQYLGILALSDEEIAIAPSAVPVGYELGQQVRITLSPTLYAAATLVGDASLPPSGVYATVAGLSRLEMPVPATVTITAPVPATGLTEEQARAQSECIEIVEGGAAQARLFLQAPHGGTVEVECDDIVRAVQGNLGDNQAVSWSCIGYRQGGGSYDRWHITSTAIQPVSYAGLASVATRSYEYALSVHGHSGNDILIGGRGDQQLKAALQSAFDRANLGFPIRILTPGEPLSGTATTNIVNRWSANGIQLELPFDLRVNHRAAVVDVLTGVYRDELIAQPQPLANQ